MPEQRPGEACIRPAETHRRRAALGAAMGVGVVLIPLGLVVAVLSHAWGVVGVCVLATALAGIGSYIGQGHNEVFVGPRGIRRVQRDCDLIATWPDLQSLAVKIPGRRIVVFSVDTAGLVVEPRSRHRSRSAQALVRNPPEGFELRLDREAADAVVAAIVQHRPGLPGVAEWKRASWPADQAKRP